MNDQARTGEEIFASFSSKVMDEMATGAGSGFASELRQMAVDNVFSTLWTRPGLDARSRSMITIAMLIALRATDELKVHIIIGVKNGLTLSEIEEIIYHASGYAGFPAAATAMVAATEALRTQGLIE